MLERQLKDLNWMEIASVFADLMCVYLNVKWDGGFDRCEAEFFWFDDILTTSGFARECDTAEESCKYLVKQIFRHGGTGPNKKNFIFPKIEFESPAELQMMLEIAGIDVQFMLTHRG